MPDLPTPLDIKAKTSFISPYLMNNSPLTCSLSDDGVTLLYPDGRDAGFKVSTPNLNPGTLLVLKVTRGGVIATLADDEQAYKEAVEKERKARVEKQEAQRKAELQLYHEKTLAANLALNIPAQWALDIKVVLSGLTEKSHGTGTNRRSVWHARILEDFTHGRLTRKKGDFLCGRDDSKLQDFSTAEHNLECYEVSCKQCLKIAKRFKEGT